VVKKSVSAWTTCDGSSDDAIGLAKAFAAAKNGAFTLVIDCPINMHVGTDIARAVFIDNGTTVEFSGSGRLIVDNTLVPAFVIANSSNITLTDWRVEYEASLPVDPAAHPAYVDNGQVVPGLQAGYAFNNLTMTKWLAANRGITFDSRQGYSTALWAGPTNQCAMFYLSGDTSKITVTGMQVAVPESAGGNSFVPVVFSFNGNYKSNQTVDRNTPYTSQYFAVPHELTFSNISFDGTYMGFVGSVQNATIDTLLSQRYGDLEDANGYYVGGVGKWFAPPHLIYFNYAPDGDPAMFNRNIQISNVTDEGIRVGKARDKGGSDPGSGNALSLKIGCVNCSVNNYATARPDGFLDVLASNQLTISNVTASYNSAFLNNLYPGWRWPKPPYENVKFENISLTDTSPVTVVLPISNAYQPSNQGIQIANVHVGMNRWAGSWALPFPAIVGDTNDISLTYTIKESNETMTRSIVGNIETTVQAMPANVPRDGSTKLSWTTQNANNCSTIGPWAGGIGVGGSRSLSFPQAGNYDITVECRNGNTASNATVRLSVGQ
jgi:hypothetical protein